MTVMIAGNCTPNMKIDLEVDPNSNGLPVLWIGIRDGHTGKLLSSAPFCKESVETLTRALQRIVTEM